MVIDSPTAQRFIAAYKDFLGSLLQPHEKAGNDVIQAALVPLFSVGPAVT